MESFNPKLYEVLGRLPLHATQDEIRKAYKTLAKLYHPDKNPNDKAYADEMMRKLNEAYAILSNTQKRADYNEELNKHLAYQEWEKKEAARKEQEMIRQAREAEKRRRRQEEAVKNRARQTVPKMKKKPESSGSGFGAFVGVGLGMLALGLLIDAMSDD